MHIFHIDTIHIHTAYTPGIYCTHKPTAYTASVTGARQTHILNRHTDKSQHTWTYFWHKWHPLFWDMEIFNLSLHLSIFPMYITCLDSYHPVVLTPAIMKCFEMILLKYINLLTGRIVLQDNVSLALHIAAHSHFDAMKHTKTPQPNRPSACLIDWTGINRAWHIYYVKYTLNSFLHYRCWIYRNLCPCFFFFIYICYNYIMFCPEVLPLTFLALVVYILNIAFKYYIYFLMVFSNGVLQIVEVSLNVSLHIMSHMVWWWQLSFLNYHLFWTRKKESGK